MANVKHLSEVVRMRDKSDTREVLRSLRASVRTALSDGTTAGYALVMWAKDGALTSAVYVDKGVIARSLVPTLVHDALNRHVAIMIGREQDE